MHTDAELLSLSAAGSDRAFSELFDRHFRAVFRYALRVTGTEADAHDATQQTFVTAWSKLRSVRLVGESALPWLLSTCRFTSLNLLRSKKRRGEVELFDEAGLTATTDDKDKAEWAMHEIEQLGEVDRRACELTLVEGLSYKDAAAQLGSTSGAVAKRVERSRSRLKALWADYERSGA